MQNPGSHAGLLVRKFLNSLAALQKRLPGQSFKGRHFFLSCRFKFSIPFFQLEPKLGAVAKMERKSESNVGIYLTMAFQNVINVRNRDACCFGKRGCTQSGRHHKFFFENDSRVNSHNAVQVCGEYTEYSAIRSFSWPKQAPNRPAGLHF